MRHATVFLALCILACTRTANTNLTSTPTQGPDNKSSKNQLLNEPIPEASWLAAGPSGPGPEPTEELLEKGRVLYLANCASCHGDTGAGNGPDSRKSPVPPRDFRQGIFKLRTTPSGSLPTDEDLFRTITRGVPGGGMPPSELPEADRWAILRYLQELTIADEEDEKRDPITIPEPPPESPESVARGRAVYLLLRCANCHGIKGDGQGARSTDMIDDWGNPIRVPDLTQPWPYKGGSTMRDLYRTLVTGLDGSPMPSYGADTGWLWTRANFPAGWEERFRNDLPAEAVEEIKAFVEQLPQKLPRDQSALRKMADDYLYDLAAYIRATFPRRVKE